jgi:hypothetical protein
LDIIVSPRRRRISNEENIDLCNVRAEDESDITSEEDEDVVEEEF